VSPDLRDNKSPIFKELEDELLQQKITKESAEEAYKKYLSQFAELARLKIAGAFYYWESSTFYFYGRTQQDPSQFYYRKWIFDGNIWSPWQKVGIEISAPYISPIMHLGKLYIFWVENNSRQKSEIKEGSEGSTSYDNNIKVVFSSVNENGKWIPAQKMKLYTHTIIFKLAGNNDLSSLATDVTQREVESNKTYKKIYPWTGIDESTGVIYLTHRYGVPSESLATSVFAAATTQLTGANAMQLAAVVPWLSSLAPWWRSIRKVNLFHNILEEGPSHYKVPSRDVICLEPLVDRQARLVIRNLSLLSHDDFDLALESILPNQRALQNWFPSHLHMISVFLMDRESTLCI
jgi:Neuraminidase-like domain